MQKLNSQDCNEIYRRVESAHISICGSLRKSRVHSSPALEIGLGLDSAVYSDLDNFQVFSGNSAKDDSVNEEM